jgi:glycosyl hydrolase family 2
VVSELPLLDVFFGELTVHRASVYARLPRPVNDEGVKLAGEVRGPRCRNAQTLPVSVPLVDLGQGPTLLARAVVPDPNFWSADNPAIYDVTVSLLHHGKTLATARRSLGFRPLGTRKQQLRSEAKNWVLRGVCGSSTTATVPAEWQSTTSAYVADYHVDRFVEASELGVPAIANLNPQQDIPLQLRQLALHPAAIMAVVRVPPGTNLKLTGIAPNILLTQAVLPRVPFTPQAWAHSIWVENTEPPVLTDLRSNSKLPIIAVRKLAQPLPIAAARAACDDLQRDLASMGQFAGYVV